MNNVFIFIVKKAIYFMCVFLSFWLSKSKGRLQLRQKNTKLVSLRLAHQPRLSDVPCPKAASDSTALRIMGILNHFQHVKVSILWREGVNYIA